MDKDLQFLLNFCSIFGIYIPQRKYASGKLKILLTLYTIALMTSLCIICIFGILLSHLVRDFIISWFVSSFVFVSQLFTYMVIMWEGLTKQREHDDFLRLLNDIEVSFKLRLRLDVCRPFIMAKLRRTFIISSGISLTGLLAFGLHFIVLTHAGYFWWALVAILAIRLRILQLLMYVELLVKYLIHLNEKINQIVCLRTEHNRRLLDIDYKNLESLEYLNHIRELYTCIYEAFYYLNEFSQASLFGITASYLLDCTCHIYWTLLALDNFLPLTTVSQALSTIIPLGLYVYKFCCVCQMAKKECQRTSLMVTRLMIATSEYTCLEARRNYRNLVYDFSLQLCHQRIEVSGKRFFNFDLRCIFGICALMMTHLIILIQFTKSDGNKEAYNRTRNEV